MNCPTDKPQDSHQIVNDVLLLRAEENIVIAFQLLLNPVCMEPLHKLLKEHAFHCFPRESKRGWKGELTDSEIGQWNLSEPVSSLVKQR